MTDLYTPYRDDIVFLQEHSSLPTQLGQPERTYRANPTQRPRLKSAG
jgi:hypothetical protein